VTGSRAVRVTAALLQRPAGLGVRVVANGRLDACVRALEQLDGGAPTALHDLRVSLRRLRSWLRTFRPYLNDTLRKRTGRRLKRLVRATNGARDLEVWGEWLVDQPDLARWHRAGARYLAQHLEAEGSAGRDRAVDRVRRRLPKIIGALRNELATYALHVRGGPSVDHRMSAAVADALRRECRRLRRRMDRVESLTDAGAIHATRIAAKKLRYLAETLEPSAAADIAQALSELQDVLGAVHDMQLLVARLVDEIEAAGAADARRKAQQRVGLELDDRAGAPPRRAVAGLAELAARAQLRAQNEFLRFTDEWTPARIAGLEASVEQIADGLVTNKSADGR
jgi:CHAD domain-containing protein